LDLRNSSSISLSWKNFKQSWCNYEIASGISEKDQKIRIATFLHVGGKEAMDRFNGFIWKRNENKNKLEDIIKKFDEDLADKTNIIAERVKFLSKKQRPGESCDEFVSALRTLISTCDYNEPEETLRDQFILQINNKKVQEKILDQAQVNSKDMTFDRAVSMTKNFELTSKQFHTEDSTTDEVNKQCFKNKKRNSNNKIQVKQVDNDELESQGSADTVGDEFINVVNHQYKKKAVIGMEIKGVNMMEIKSSQEETLHSTAKGKESPMRSNL